MHVWNGIVFIFFLTKVEIQIVRYYNLKCQCFCSAGNLMLGLVPLSYNYYPMLGAFNLEFLKMICSALFSLSVI